jgi:hypothetical protein
MLTNDRVMQVEQFEMSWQFKLSQIRKLQGETIENAYNRALLVRDVWNDQTAKLYYRTQERSLDLELNEAIADLCIRSFQQLLELLEQFPDRQDWINARSLHWLMAKKVDEDNKRIRAENRRILQDRENEKTEQTRLRPAAPNHSRSDAPSPLATKQSPSPSDSPIFQAAKIVGVDAEAPHAVFSEQAIVWLGSYCGTIRLRFSTSSGWTVIQDIHGEGEVHIHSSTLHDALAKTVNAVAGKI